MDYARDRVSVGLRLVKLLQIGFVDLVIFSYLKTLAL